MIPRKTKGLYIESPIVTQMYKCSCLSVLETVSNLACISSVALLFCSEIFSVVIQIYVSHKHVILRKAVMKSYIYYLQHHNSQSFKCVLSLPTPKPKQLVKMPTSRNVKTNHWCYKPAPKHTHRSSRIMEIY